MIDMALMYEPKLTSISIGNRGKYVFPGSAAETPETLYAVYDLAIFQCSGSKLWARGVSHITAMQASPELLLWQQGHTGD
jgi:hypothetical protein